VFIAVQASAGGFIVLILEEGFVGSGSVSATPLVSGVAEVQITSRTR
jgi:hypothetical protein